MAPPNIKVDNLFNSLKGLQQGRLRLEQNLEELRAKKRGLETALDEAHAKHAQVRDVNQKMKETLKIAQHKVAQTQQQQASLQVDAKVKANRIAELNKRIEDERGKHTEETLEFNGKLSDLADCFTSARNFHSNGNLQRQIQETEKETAAFDADLAEYLAETEQPQKQLTKSAEEQETAEEKAKEIGIDKDDQTAVLQMFDDDFDHATRVTDTLMDEADQLERKLEELQLSGSDDIQM
ncbi:hypothetical protein NP493_667g01042 [Ridgeia piscesae]|uniref:Uncharacterized protein n=1 Tax=Ridgeia piscesae TaxID=27915 RepID=A0AAD9NN20_RIDPI|nr:hypothetical protein NP493_667g01042 [Ridgeia piscesae]